MECPGYGLRLRWATTSSTSRPSSKPLSTPQAVIPHPDTRGNSRPQLSDLSPEKISAQPARDPTIFTLSDSVIMKFFDYYATSIAPMMVWLDSEANEYRRLVVPMAKHHPVLRLAICAIAAAHMPQEPDYGREFSSAACEAAITQITEQIRQMNVVENNLVVEGIYGSIEGTLASMLVLANQSLFGAELPRARFHRQAARILLHTLSLKRSPSEELFAFLKNQLALCDVLMCTTLFDPEQIQAVILPELGRGDVVLGRFLQVVHKITTLSFQETETISRDPVALLEELEDEFELARGSSLLAAGQMMEGRCHQFKEDFVRFINIFHHSGVLYACKRLQLELGPAAQYHADKLFQSLNQFHDVKSIMHNLAWPLFVAGICNCRHPERQHFIATTCGLMSASTGFRHFSKIRTFLQELWQTPQQDWIIVAREWEERGNPVVAV
ncbi:hypothetical protein H2204_003245 [Knufia peltigerae]|uniref:Fungal-specific transcription factor domain-containing protein n=1 Tax=Knufia peltigerae TaxID=1002370 RepID=A0AA38Y9M4_9EURO|nr:hypothetical protein H2204_003245 [Knufia peltigerae]